MSAQRLAAERTRGLAKFAGKQVFFCGVFSFEESISSDMSVLISGVDEKAIWMLAYK